jgi:excisionase family DNA binding protein
MKTKSAATSQSKRLLEPNGTLLDIDAVATALGVTPRHVQRLVSERRVPFLKIGRFVRFDAAELNAWVDQQRVAPARHSTWQDAHWR